MSIKLLLCLVIFVIFIVIVYIPVVNKSKQKVVESFSTDRAYPSPLMTAHDQFINNQSNEYVQKLKIIKDLAVSVSETMDLSESDHESLKTELYRKIFEKAAFAINNEEQNTGCSISESFKCKLYKYICIFIYKTLISPTSLQGAGGLDEYITTLSNTAEVTDYLDLNSTDDARKELNLKNNQLKKKVEAILTKYFNLLEATTLLSKKKKFIEEAVYSIIFNSYFVIYPSSQSQLACSLYTNNNCPVVPFTNIAGDNVGTDQVNYIEAKYKCSKDTTLPLCVNNTNNQQRIDYCGALNGYGETMCEHTIDAITETACQYEDLTQRCINSNSITERVSTNLGSGDDNKCHLIYNNNLTDFENTCNGVSDCKFLKVEDSNGNEHGLCYEVDTAGSQPERPANFCLSLSRLKVDDEIKRLARGSDATPVCDLDMDEHNIFSGISRGRNSDNTDYLHTEEIECHALDESDYKIIEENAANYAGDRRLKDSDEKELPTILGIENQKDICEYIPAGRGSDLKKCKFVEFPRYIPQDENSKYSKIGMCIPKNTSFKLNVDLIKNKEKCNGRNLVWSEENNKCVDVSQSCNSVKHKNVCNYKKNCLWQSTPTPDSFNEPYELGYCRDLSSSLERIDTLVDNIHEKHIEDAVKVADLEKTISNLASKFKNKLASLPIY